MEKALRDKRRAIITCVCSLLVGIALTAAAIICMKEPLYLYMALLAVASAICYYIFAFSIFRFLDARAATELIDIIDCSGSGRVPVSISEIAIAMGWNPNSTRRFIGRCRRKGYLN